ncbi:MAG: lytic murein transglycosylase B [Betaproteobacteria bacterium]|nr:lytic murein transglycosylase B [Betaproteobacteria bacterium]
MMRTFAALLATFLLCPGQAVADGGFVDRPEVRDFIDDMQARHGFGRTELNRLFRKLTPQPRALLAIAPPKDPVAKSWQAYRARFIESARVEGGLRFWDRHLTMLEAARQRYGVPEEVIVAIIGVETIYGRNKGRFPTLATLATLAFDYPPRADLFLRELEALLLLARETGSDPLAFQGSFAGALGIPQFLPSSVRNWGVDFDGDGQVDLNGSAADAIGSVANFLASHGWESDGPIAHPAQVEGTRHEELLDGAVLPRLAFSDMRGYGVSAHGAPDAPCVLVDLVTPNAATEYWLGFRNFYVITRYNRSSFYAMAVFALSQELLARRKARLASR